MWFRGQNVPNREKQDSVVFVSAVTVYLPANHLINA